MVLEIYNSVLANNESAVSTYALHVSNFISHQYTHMHRVISEYKTLHALVTCWRQLKSQCRLLLFTVGINQL